MGGTTLHAGIVAQWLEIMLVLTFLKICYYDGQWYLIWCNDTCSTYSLYLPYFIGCVY